MGTLRKKAPFQTEVAASILALVLIMVTMNFAANRTLSRMTNDLRQSQRDKLTKTALRISAEMERNGDDLPAQDALDAIIENEDIAFALLLDSNLTEIAAAPTRFPFAARQRIRDLLFGNNHRSLFEENKFQFTYVRESESEWEVFHCPLTSAGQWRVLALASTTRTLAAAERDARYLLILGIVIVALISIGVLTLFRGVTLPFRRIRDSVAEVGGSSSDAERAVDELVDKYKETIAQLRSKEARLLELNERLEGRLGDVERFNDSLLGAISTGVVALDSQGRVIGINDKARLHLGLQGSSGAASCQTGPPEDYVGLFSEYPEVKARIESLLLNPRGDVNDFDYERIDHDGAVCTYRVALIALLDERDSLRELMLLISDQTEVARAQKRLEDSRQLATLGEMSAGLAHQLRNSISAAMGFTALAKRKAGYAHTDSTDTDNAGAGAPLDSLHKELEEEAALVDRFLSFAKPLALSVEKTAITEFLNKSLLAYRANPATDSRVHALVQTDGEAELDCLLLKQVIGNLVDNALRASESNDSPVDITADVTASEVILIVSDYGHGISPEEQEKIFTPFYSSSPSGAGLGLPLARKIVELHNGTLELVSRPECGATFTIRIPRYQDSESLKESKKSFADRETREAPESLPNKNS